MEVAMNALGMFGQSNEIEEQADQFRIAVQLARGSTDPRELSASLEECAELFEAQHTQLKSLVEEQCGVVRRAQIKGVRQDRTLCREPLVTLVLGSGEIVDVLLTDTSFVERMLPGCIADVTADHRKILDVEQEIPLCALGTLRRVHRVDGQVKLDVACDEHGGSIVEMWPAWTFPTDQATVGRRVRHFGKFCYEQSEPEPSAFLEKKRQRKDYRVETAEVFGLDQQRFIREIRTAIEIHLHPDRFPNREREGENRFLAYGPPAVGKSESIRAAITEARRKLPDLAYYTLHGNAFSGSLVGQTSGQIAETFEEANRKAAEGQLVVLVVEEATSLLLNRTQAAHYLDCGNSLQGSETLFAKMDSADGGLHRDVLLIVTSNRADLMDSAGKSRFILVPIRTFGPVEFGEILRNFARKNWDCYEGGWEDGFGAAVDCALKTKIGTVKIGSDDRDVLMKHVINGRIAQWAHIQACRFLDHLVCEFGDRESSPCPRITPALLHTLMVRRAVDEYATYTTENCRDMFTGTDLVRESKEGAMREPKALRFEDVELPEDLDARPMIAGFGS
jgi:hypothetical protein